ncbi:cytochrome P450 [Archangium violaceum]|uniref:cytochrome P450 n=1 Tax=Archangium violaceum TaxID=83451 RepID=UPI0019515668|nr:cytochrome P450 [Archangium violaceum]QRO00328.1 cytochrome P450 [Archangium violaceum]
MSSRLNLLAPEVRANPYPFYAELRRNAPVSQVDPGGLWAVSRYDDLITVMKNPQVFSSEGIRQTYRPAWIPDYPLADSMLVMDPPEHTRLRALVSRAFGHSMLSRMEPRIRALAKEAVAALTPGQTVDFVEAFSFRIPLAVLGEMAGLPASLHPRFRQWVEVITHFTSIGPNDTAKHEQMRATVNEARQYFAQVLEARRKEPREDLLSDLLRAQVDGESLTETELMGFMFLLLVAGLETTVHLLSLGLMRLQEEPELLARLRADTSLIPRFVEEALRLHCPAHGIVRLTTQDVELGGARIPKGARLLLMIASGNRDESHFPDPDRFDLDRPNPQNLPFGYGAHFCLGAHLSRIETRVALEELLARFVRLTPGDGEVKWNASLIIRGPIRLPLVAHSA